MTPSQLPLVLQVAPFYPPHLGGVETTAEALARSISSTRNVAVLTSDGAARSLPRCERDGHLTVRRLRAVEVAHTPIAPALVTRLLRAPHDCVVHVHVAQAFFPEVVWVTSRVRGRRPYVAHFHLDVGRSGSAGRLLPFYKRHVLGRVLRDAAVVIALSDAQAEFLVARYGCAQERVVVVPNAVPPGLPDDSGEVIGRYDGTRALRLLFVGRVSIQKNLPLLLEAVHAMTRPAELVVAGGGDDLPAVKELATQLGMTGVNFTDQLERSELSKWYRWADAFVITSEREGMPLAVLEAMSFGLPVIGTEVDGLRSLLAGIGELVEARPSAVARVLDELAADPARLEKLATLSQEHATTVGWGDTVARIEEIYAQISASRSTL